MSVAQMACTALGGEMDGRNACRVPGPKHTKRDRSLSVKDDPDNVDGFVVFSHAKDDPIVCRDYIREAIGAPAWQPALRQARAEYVYKAEHGEPYLRVTRAWRDGAKTFYQHSWNGTAWVKGAPSVRIPYRLPEMIAATGTVYVVEGEKDADRLASLGLVATCNPMGAGKWRDELNHWFTGKHVVILADNDDVGRQQAGDVEGALRGNAASVRQVHFPMLPEKGDVSDWLDLGNSKDDLLAYVAGHEEKASATPPRLTSFNARDLMSMEFAPVRYVVPGYFAEGCTILAGAAKLGKSWLVLQTALAVARGATCLGGKCERGDVLYLALEDNARRLKDRLLKQNPADGLLGLEMPAALQFETEWLSADRGGVAKIEEWLKAHPDAKMVIIDVLKMFRAQRKGNKNAYDLDYEDIRPLTRLAGIYKVAVVVVHHTNKGAHTADPFDRVSGTGGISGAADATLTMERNEAGMVQLYGRGRDIEEIETAIAFSKETCTWSVRGNAAEVSMSDTATRIVRAMREIGEPAGPVAIAAAAGLKAVDVRQHLPRLAKAGQIHKEGRGQYAVTEESNVPFTPALLSSQTSQPNPQNPESNESNESNRGREGHHIEASQTANLAGDECDVCDAGLGTPAPHGPSPLEVSP